jgi:iron complex outermembrane receptor protein
MNTKTPNLRGSFFTTSALHGLLMAGACFSFAAMANAQDATAPSDTITLQTFTVNTTKDIGYRAGNSVSATRVDTPIADLPFSISAIDQQFIQDTAPADLTDIAQTATGVTSGAKEFNAGADSFTIRGFQQGPQRNGFSVASVYVDPVSIERVEVVKGPATLLYGQIQPGGVVNYITKQPMPDKTFLNVAVAYGNDNYARATVDVNVPGSNNTLLFRFDASYTNELQFENIPNKSTKQAYVPNLTWNINKNTTLKLNYSSFNRYENPAAVYPPNMDVMAPSSVAKDLGNANQPYNNLATGVLTNAPFGVDDPNGLNATPNNGGATIAGTVKDAADTGFSGPYPGLPHNFDYDNKSDYRRTGLQDANAELDTKINDNWVSRVDFDYNTSAVTFNQTGVGDVFLAPPNSMTYTAPANNAASPWAASARWLALTPLQQAGEELAFAQAIQANPANALNGQPAIIVRRPRIQQTYGDGWTVQPEFAGKYEFSWVKLAPLVGAVYDKNWNTNIIRQNGGANSTSPYYATWDVNPNSPTFVGPNQINQNPTPISPSTYGTSPTNTFPPNTWTQSWSSDQAIYGLLNAQFLHDRIIVLGGARYQRSQSQTTNYIATTTNPVGTGLRTHYTTPQIGVGFKVLPHVMLYASYSTSYVFNAAFTSTINSANTLVIGPQEKPVTSESEEAGVKSDFLNGKVSSTLSVYRIVENDVPQTASIPTSNGTLTPTFQGAVVRSQGVEAEFTVSPIESLDLTGGIAEDDIRNTSEVPGEQIFLGKHPPFTAKTLANLWARYNTPVKGLWVGAGFKYTGPTAGNLAGVDLIYPSYWLFNSAVGYSWTMFGKGFDVVVNWDNMTNKFYQPADQEIGLPSRVVATVTAHF